MDLEAPTKLRRDGTGGSALVVAMLVTAILALLGISFLLLAETERRIAQNEKRAAQSLYVAEAGLRAVKRWFDDPGGAMLAPAPSVVDRTLRRIIDETDPRNPAAAIPADGVLGSFPYYKQGQDADLDGRDDLFDRPYRGGLVHALQGTEDGPDMRIDDASGPGATFLENLSTMLLPGFPGEPGGVHARISRIDVYAPPYERLGAVWQRAGIASVAITVRVYQDHAGGREILAERRLEAELGEAPYREQGPQGPLHSCGDISFVPRTGGDMTVRWGAMMARRNVDVGDPDQLPIPRSWPRVPPSRPGADDLFPTDPATFDAFRAGIVGDNPIDDPWFRILSGGVISGSSGSQVEPPSTTVPQNYSNLIQNLGVAVCPHYDYRLWKAIAQSGGPDVRYFSWTAGGFRENSLGAPMTFFEVTDGEAGVFFFDTSTGTEPVDADSDGNFENLTPAVTVPAGDWNFSGFIFLNAASFEVDGVTGTAIDLTPPGEPFLDEDDDGEYDVGERFLNLDYATATATDGEVRAFGTESGSVRDARGSDVTGATVSFRGILYNTGAFEATGSGTFYGSVVANQGVTQAPDDGSVPTPTLIWDASLAVDWPPAGLVGVPRVVITGWDVGH